MSRKRRGERRKRRRVILIFAEDATDAGALRELTQAAKPKAPSIKHLTPPPVSVLSAALETRERRAKKILSVVKAEEVRSEVVAVFIHQDCDACEPAHREAAEAIRDDYEAAAAELSVSAPIVPVTPAWEIEAWWFLWPDAVIAYRPSWRRPSRTGKQVGKIKEAKEAFRKAVRPKGRKPGQVPDYCEADGPHIAAQVRKRAELRSPDAVSKSFRCFLESLDALDL